MKKAISMVVCVCVRLIISQGKIIIRIIIMMIEIKIISLLYYYYYKWPRSFENVNMNDYGF